MISFTGDHGWSTGEHDVWCKMTNSEAGTRVPLFFRAPWVKTAVGVKSTALAELVDFFPSADRGSNAGPRLAHISCF